MRNRKAKKPKLPRAPLPRQTGGAHKERKRATRGAERKAKHRRMSASVTLRPLDCRAECTYCTRDWPLDPYYDYWP